MRTRVTAGLAIAILLLQALALSCNKPATTSPTSPTPSTPTCSATIPEDQRSVSIGPEPALLALPVTAPEGCAWSATANAAFLQIASGGTGTGNGTVRVNVSQNLASQRAGGVSVGGITAAVTQNSAGSSSCTFEVGPASVQSGASGDEVTVTVAVTQGTNCAWTAGTSDPFLTVASGQTGVGPGAVRVVVAKNTGPARVGQLIAAGRTVVFSQDGAAAAPCELSVSPRSVSVPLDGGETQFRVSVDSGAGCVWSAASPFANYLTVLNPGPNVDAGIVRVIAASNPGTSRSANLVIAGRQVTVQQPERPGVCAISVIPASIDVAASATTTSYVVRMLSGTFDLCPWFYHTTSTFARSVNVTNVHATDTTVTVTVDANPGFVRTADLQVRWGINESLSSEHIEHVTLNQAGLPLPPCEYSMSPTTFNVGAAATTVMGTLTELNRTGCGFGVTVSVSWVLPTMDVTPVKGVHSISVKVSANPGAARTGTFTVAGITVTVNQAAGPAATHAGAGSARAPR